MHGSRRTDFQRRRILEEFGTGRVAREIANQFGCKDSYPAKLARNAGWPKRPMIFEGAARDRWMARIAQLAASKNLMAYIVLIGSCGLIVVAMANYREPLPVVAGTPVAVAQIATTFDGRWPEIRKLDRALFSSEPMVPIRVRTESIRMETAEASQQTSEPDEVVPMPRARPKTSVRYTRGGDGDICSRHGMRKTWTIKRHWRSWRCRR
jgi:hypothetical protein